MRATVPLFVAMALTAGCHTTPPATTAQSAPATSASSTQAPGNSTKVAMASNVATPSATTDDGTDQELVRQGYKATRRNGNLLYCKAETTVGSRFSSNVCLTADQVRERQRTAKEDLQHLHQNGCTGSSGCGN
jgi:hypothetical protein